MSKPQLHLRFTTDQVRLILDWYEAGSLSVRNARERLEISESHFFRLFAAYRKNPSRFSIEYPERMAPNRLSKDIDAIIRRELLKEQSLILNKDMPVRTYNYAAVRDEVAKRSGRNISAEVVRGRAHTWGFEVSRPKDKRKHDWTVLTSAPGQLLQHDASTHLWSPYAKEKWVLVTTLDDWSRKLLFADFYEEETAFAHIEAAESVILAHGAGLAYYVDNHRIFRFVCHRDSFWKTQVKGTDDVMTQWKRALAICGMRVFYATSPEGKGKIERPYRWLQDRIVRRSAKEDIRTIAEARTILQSEVDRYNRHQVHSTTGEIPDIRFERAKEEGLSIFKPFVLPAPYRSTKDIFCLREERVVDGYGHISWRGHSIPAPKGICEGEKVELHIIADPGAPEVRIWHEGRVRLVLKLGPGRSS